MFCKIILIRDTHFKSKFKKILPKDFFDESAKKLRLAQSLMSSYFKNQS